MRSLPLSYPEAPAVPGSSSGGGSQKRVRVTGKQTPSATGNLRTQQSRREPSRRADYQAFYG
eukprot:4552412-Prorocentrum_lima.AAC.1